MEKEIGSQHLADLAYEAVLVRRDSWSDFVGFLGHVDQKEILAGGVTFKVLGNGCERVALLGPDGVVYKVAVFDRFQSWDEIETFRLMEALGLPFTPDFWKWSDSVNAMPRYTPVSDLLGPTPKGYASAFVDLEAISEDISTENVGIREDGSIVLIDGGCSTDRDVTEKYFGVRLD